MICNFQPVVRRADGYHLKCEVCGVERIVDSIPYYRQCGTGQRLLAVGPEEIARRKTICLACEDWDEELLGCTLVAELERAKLTEYKQARGHCARGCMGDKPLW